MENKDEIIYAENLSLSEFLKVLFSKDCERLYPNNHFPTEEMMHEYFKTISQKTEDEIRLLLRKFIIPNTTFGKDALTAQWMVSELKEGKRMDEFGLPEYNRRLYKKFLTNQGEVWEGLTWVLDLLPHFPIEAIKAIDAYFLANCQALPDTWLNALSDCTEIIRARYIKYEHPKEIFWDLAPKDFEYLIAALYEELGYDIQLTKSSYDGGVDIFAQRNEPTRKEKLVIQCKRYTKQTIGVETVRTLQGVITDTKSTKGVLITTSKFSSEAIKFEKNNPSIELIDIIKLTELLNGNLGTFWINKIDTHIKEQKRKLIDSQSS